LITGASSGIGAALAREFARRGHSLVLTARREAELDRLADEIARTGAPRPQVIAADIATSDGIDALARGLAEGELAPAILVNNAGYGLLGEAAKLDLQQQLGMIDLNVRALTDLTLRLLDGITRQKGGILNVASIASFFPGPGMTIYHATKAYVLSFTEALYGELVPQGVKVCALCPGPVPTAFLSNAGIPHDYVPRFLARSADRVAREGYAGFIRGHRVVVPGSPNRVLTLLPRLLPRGLIADATAWRWRRLR
jgi:short-subunit dehydrogenase